VRVDTAAYRDYVVPPHYDSLIAKLIVHGTTRQEAIARGRRALELFIVERSEDLHPTSPEDSRRRTLHLRGSFHQVHGGV